MKIKRYWITFAIVILLSGSACSTIGLVIGKEDPLTYKTQDYRIANLTEFSSHWVRVTDDRPLATIKNTEKAQQKPSRKNSDGEWVADLTYQSKLTASIISLNSTCRKSFATQAESLSNYTHTLLLGFSDLQKRRESPMALTGRSALETLAEGKVQDQAMKVKTVVLRDQSCIYDLMYLARPQHFAQDEEIFSRFVKSFSLQ